MIKRMREATRRFEKGIEEIVHRHDMTLPQFEVLAYVYTMPEADIYLGEIADAIMCSRGNLTGICDRLEDAGHINRVRSDKDRRVIHIVLTQAGFNAASEVLVEVEHYTAAMDRHLQAATGMTTENLDSILEVVDRSGHAVVA